MKENQHRAPGRPRFDDIKQPTHERILFVASKLFIENGYQKVSIDDVAKDADVTKASVYYHYATKSELFTETMVHMMLRIRNRIVSLLAAKKPLRERLFDVAKAHLKATIQMDLDGFMRETKRTLTPEQVLKMREAEEKLYFALEDAFISAIASGEIPEVNSSFAAHSFIALLRVGNYRNADHTGLFPSEKMATEHIIEFFWNGLLPRQ